MTDVVVDASVAVKWFVADGEKNVERARALLEEHRAGETRLVAPALMPVEVLNALRRAPGGADVLPQAAQALADVEIELVAPDAAMLAEIARLVAEHGLTAFDASYAVLALERECRLVSADRRAFADLPGLLVEIL